MPATASWLLPAAGVCALADWAAVGRGLKHYEYIFKPATMFSLLGFALLLEPDLIDRRSWFVGALALSLAGDVFLMLPRDLFVAGLSAFLLAHLAYIAGFLFVDTSAATSLLLALAAVLVAAVPLAVRILPAARRTDPKIVPPVCVYMAAISTMVAAALASGEVLAGAGAVLFFASDSLIAWNRFVRPASWAPVAIMVTYHLGQAGLIASLAS